MKLGMFAYPWDMANYPREHMSAYLALGCDMIAMSSVYHQCNVLDMRSLRVYERSCAGASFAISPELYGRVKPHVTVDLTQAQLQLRDLCEKLGIEWRSWVVSLHNDQIGETWPDTTVQNVWGDRYASALCVNHPDIREYANALIEDVVQTFNPARLVMETQGWLQAFHGRHHEFLLARMTPAVKYFLTLCFCPHCQAAAEKYGVDGIEARRTTDMILKQLLNSETTYSDNEQKQLLHLFLEYPVLYQYQRFRMASVTELISETAQTSHKCGVSYDIIPSAAPFQINEMHVEGSAFRDLAPYVDQFVPLCYSRNETFSAIRRNVDLFAADAPLSLTLNLDRTRYDDIQEFKMKVKDAVDAGANDIYCYNYSLATNEVLGWVKQAYTSIRESGVGR